MAAGATIATRERRRRRADRAVPRHAGGRARRRAQTRSTPMAATSPTSPRISKAAAAASPARRTEDLRGYLARARRARLQAPRRWRGISRRCASCSGFSTPKENAATIRRRCWKGPKRGRALPKILSIAEVDELLDAARRAAEDETPGAGRAPARGAAQLPDRSRLRDRLARLRTGGAAGVRRAARPAHAGGARQGRQGTAGAAQPGGQAQHGRVSCIARRRVQRSRNGCFPPSASRATSPGSISPAN